MVTQSRYKLYDSLLYVKQALGAVKLMIYVFQHTSKMTSNAYMFARMSVQKERARFGHL